MQPWILIDTAQIPGGGALRLMRRGADFSMRLDQVELMGSRVSGSEEALAALGCATLRNKPKACVLIGGLGMGFTLRAVLNLLGQDAHVVVAELLPAVVAWARGPLSSLSGDSLADPRVTVQVEDVGQTIRRARAAYDAILLDVDNGPAGLTRDSNTGLYGLKALEAAAAALRPGGTLAVWSAADDAAFTERLRNAGFLARVHAARAHRNRGARHTVWTASRPHAEARP